LSSHCDLRDGITSNAASIGIDSLVEKCLTLIRKHIFPEAHRVNPSIEIELSLSKPRLWKYILSPHEIAFILDRIDLERIAGVNAMHIRGCYMPESGKIFLNKDSWCIETVIHETLHSCSLTSMIPELNKYRIFYEGLTELYTGYILYKEFHDTYENCWKAEIGRHCQLTYEQSTKIWCAFCNFIPISKTTVVYFHADSTDRHTAFNNFVESIRGRGYSRFQNPIDIRGPSAHINLYNECSSNFGIEFSRICSSREKFTDFANIIV